MFNLLSKKNSVFEISAPISGRCIELEHVNDEVFSKKMVGEGFAVIPNIESNVVVSPVNGKIIMIPDTKHAIGIKVKEKNVEILIHVGLDTVKLGGKGFEVLVGEGDDVHTGLPLIRFDKIELNNMGYDLTTIVIFTSGYSKEIFLGKLSNTQVNEGQVLLKS